MYPAVRVSLIMHTPPVCLSVAHPVTVSDIILHIRVYLRLPGLLQCDIIRYHRHSAVSVLDTARFLFDWWIYRDSSVQ